MEHAKYCNQNSKSRVNRHNQIVHDLVGILHRYQVKEIRRAEKVNANGNYADIRATRQNGVIDIDLTIVRSSSFEKVFGEKVKKHTPSGENASNGPEVVVLPVVCDNYGTIYSKSVGMLMHHFPLMKITQLYSSLVRRNAQYLTIASHDEDERDKTLREKRLEVDGALASAEVVK